MSRSGDFRGDNRQTDRRTDGQTDGQMDRQTDVTPAHARGITKTITTRPITLPLAHACGVKKSRSTVSHKFYD